MAAMTPEELRRRLVLDRAEAAMKREMESSDAPFLGLLGDTLNEDSQKVVEATIQLNPSVAWYCRNLQKYPALFAMRLAWFVMKGTHRYFLTGGIDFVMDEQSATSILYTRFEPT